MSIIKTTFTAAALAPVAWIAYSRFGIDHDVELPKAIEADQKQARTIAGGELSYYVDKSVEGPPLVLIHSVNAAANPREMQPLFDHYRGSRPVYAIDLPGFGFSDRSDRHYNPQLFASAIAEFLLVEVGEPADVVALSLGCEFVALAAMENPDLFTSLVFISPTGLAEEEVLSVTDAAKKRVRPDLLYKLFSFPLWSQAFYDLVVTKPSLRFFSPGKADTSTSDTAPGYEYLTSHRPGAKNVPLYFVAGKLFTPSIAESIYAKLRVPVLSLYGHDRYTTFGKMPMVNDRNPDWHSFRLDDDGSMIHQESPDLTTAAMDEFWTRIGKAAS